MAGGQGATIFTLRNMAGVTATTTCAGSANTIYVVGPPQTYTITNPSPNVPGRYLGLFILETLVGVDGFPWYRWDSDVRMRNDLPIPTMYTATYAP